MPPASRGLQREPAPIWRCAAFPARALAMRPRFAGKAPSCSLQQMHRVRSGLPPSLALHLNGAKAPAGAHLDDVPTQIVAETTVLADTTTKRRRPGMTQFTWMAAGALVLFLVIGGQRLFVAVENTVVGHHKIIVDVHQDESSQRAVL